MDDNDMPKISLFQTRKIPFSDKYARSYLCQHVFKSCNSFLYNNNYNVDDDEDDDGG